MAKDIFYRDRYQKHASNKTNDNILQTRYNVVLRRIMITSYKKEISDIYGIEVKVLKNREGVNIIIGREVIAKFKYCDWPYWCFNNLYGTKTVSIYDKITYHIDHCISTYIDNPFKRDMISRLQFEYKLKMLGL